MSANAYRVERTRRGATITIPGFRTVSELNAHEAWQARSRRAKQQRSLVGLCLRASGVAGMMGDAPLDVTFVRVAPSRGLDPGDNLPSSQKHVRDGVADVLGINDNDPRVTWHYAQRTGPWGIVIMIAASR